MAQRETITAQELRDLVIRAFERTGMGRNDAACIADLLVWADLSGHGSHGVVRVERYLAFIAQGDLGPTARPACDIDLGALFRVEAAGAAGAVAMAFAVDEAAGRARRHGVALGLVANTTHTGAAGYHALRLSGQGMAAIIGAASLPLMAYQGTTAAAVSTAPLAIAVPAAGRPDIVLDMASSAVALGKIREAAAAGRSIPEGWALTADGRPATDPAEASVQLPMAGPKGAGLALMLECLCSLLTAAPILAPAIEGRAAGRKPPHRQNALVIAIDIAALRAPEGFAADAARLATAISGLPRAEGSGEILMPGERSARLRAQRSVEGITLPASRLGMLREFAGRQ